MLLLLPPSETKRDGGDGPPLDYSALRFPRLTAARRAVVRAVAAQAKDPDAAMRALKLSPRQAAEVERNRAVAKSPTMPAIDRYTGVLYDALDASTLSEASRERAASAVVVQSALLGPVGALDLIPAYRLSHDSRVPELPLKRHWSARAGKELAGVDGLVLDLRSEGYAALAPLAPGSDRRYLRVVTRGEDGTARALNHFNKSAKGAFTRFLLTVDEAPDDLGSLHGICARAGFELRDGRAGELELVVPAGHWDPRDVA